MNSVAPEIEFRDHLCISLIVSFASSLFVVFFLYREYKKIWLIWSHSWHENIRHGHANGDKKKKPPVISVLSW